MSKRKDRYVVGTIYRGDFWIRGVENGSISPTTLKDATKQKFPSDKIYELVPLKEKKKCPKQK